MVTQLVRWQVAVVAGYGMTEVAQIVSRPSEGRFAAIWTGVGAAAAKNPSLGLDTRSSRSISEMRYILVLIEMEDDGIYPRHPPSGTLQVTRKVLDKPCQ